MYFGTPYIFLLEIAPGSNRCMCRYQLRYKDEHSWLPLLPLTSTGNIVDDNEAFLAGNLEIVGGFEGLLDQFCLPSECKNGESSLLIVDEATSAAICHTIGALET